jgi:hypothetical protein
MIAKTSLRKTTVIGLKSSFAILNQMNENAQKIMARITAPYILIFTFNFSEPAFFRHCEGI